MVEANTTNTNMKYRYLGNSGIRVSVLSWGNWINVNDSLPYEQMLRHALDAGVNFFDTAEIYGAGEGETSLGKALKKINVRRESIVVSTKIFKCGKGLNDCFLSRKHIVEGLRNSLRRLQLDYVDVVFCHRYDEETPIEEVCRAMNWVIDQGMAFYWATSAWRGSQIMEAYAVCDKNGWSRPIADQCQYNMLVRDDLEKEYAHLFDKYRMGTTVWSPLMSGILTGKYREKVDKGTRLDISSAEAGQHARYYTKNKKEIDDKLTKLEAVAKKLNCSLAQLALAWVIKNPDVSTCILGTSSLEQLIENLKALEISDLLDLETENLIDEILNNAPDQSLNWRDFTPKEKRRLYTIYGKKFL